MKNWLPGEIIEANALNNIEQGIETNSNNIQIINNTISNMIKVDYVKIINAQQQLGGYIKTLNKTWKEIKDSLIDGNIVIAVEEQNDNLIHQYLITTLNYVNNQYKVVIDNLEYIATVQTDNPVYQIN